MIGTWTDGKIDPYWNRTHTLALVRLAFSVVILTIRTMPLWLRALIVLFFFDLMDGCTTPFGGPTTRCQSLAYQKMDKIVDLVLLYLLVFVLLPNECLDVQKQQRTSFGDRCVISHGVQIRSLDPFYLRLIQFLVAFRAVGVIFFLFSNKQEWLILFANYAEFVLILVLLGFTQAGILILAGVAKLLQEWYIHGKK